MTNVGFEGLVGPDDFGTVPNGYAGLEWTNFGVLGKGLIHDAYPHGGYRNVVHQQAVAYLYPPEGTDCDSAISLTDGTFTLKSGIFAAAWNEGEEVTFKAYLDGVLVGRKTVVLDETAIQISFGAKFAHIDAVRIQSSGGTVVDPEEGSGAYLAADNLKLLLDTLPAPPETDQSPRAHWSDWPLA
jgi:hypothetical protein